MRLSRTDNSLLAEWWFTIDRTVLAVLLILAGSGLVLSFAASPAVAIRKGFPAFHFAERHLLFATVGALLIIAVSLLSPRQIRRLALVATFVGLGLMVWVAMTGQDINGARRWVRFAGYSFQPSELVKPGFVVLSAWLLAEARARADVSALAMALGLLVLFAGLLLLQPDVGQTLLIALVWGALFYVSGQPVLLAALFAGCGLLGLGGAYLTFDHVRRRVDRFFDPASGDTFQVDRALQSFSEGGLLGRGPGEGSIKSVLPDAHTDFILAVIAEEFGVIACLVLLGLYVFIVLRALQRVLREPDLFTRLGVTGLALLIGLQAAINMGVNVGLMPAKGMTLPLISAGGSSGLAVSISAGMLLALMRRRPDGAQVKMPQLRPRLETAESGLGVRPS